MNKILKRITLLALSATLVLTLIFTAGQTTNISAEETKVYTTTINSGDVTSQPLVPTEPQPEAPITVDQEVSQDSIDNDEVTEQDILNHEVETPVSAEIEVLTLKENEVVVNSFDELYTLVTNRGNGVYDTYYMSQDFVVSKSLTVPEGYSFVLDGRDPVTGEYHSLTARENDDFFTYAFKAKNATPTTMHFRNMNISTYNKYGLMYSGYDNTTFIYENVSFTGTTLVHNLKGKVVLNNFTATMKSGYSQELARALEINFYGDNVITDFSSKNGPTFNSATTALVFEEGSSTKISSDYRAIYSKSMDLKPNSSLDVEIVTAYDASTVSIIQTGILTMKGANLNVVINSYTRTSAIVLTDEMIISQSNVYINSNRSWQALTAKNRIEIVDGSTVTIEADYTSPDVIDQTSESTPYTQGLVIDNSTVNLNIDYAYAGMMKSRSDMIINNSTVNMQAAKINREAISTMGNLTITNSNIWADSNDSRIGAVSVAKKFMIEDSDILVDSEGNAGTVSKYHMITAKEFESKNARVNLIIDDKEIIGIFDVEKHIKIVNDGTKPSWFIADGNHKMALLNTKKTPTIEVTTQQINLWNDIDSTTSADIRIFNKDNSTGTLEFTVGTDNSINIIRNTFVPHEGSNKIETGIFNGRATYAMGHVMFQNHSGDDQDIIDFKTNPNAAITFNYNGNQVIEGNADTNGRYYAELDQPLGVDYHTITIKDGRFEIVEVLDYTIYGSVDLTHYPKTIQFGDVDIRNTAGTHARHDTMTLRVEDTRYERTGWKLEVRAKQELTDTSGRNSVLHDSLIFKKNAQHNGNVINNRPIVVYETPENYDAVTELNFANDLGVLMQLGGPNGIYANTGYTAESEWILTYK